MVSKFFKEFEGNKASFQQKGYDTTYSDNIVLIKDTANNGEGACIYARGSYFGNFAELIAALSYVKGVKLGSDTYTAALGGGFVEFVASDPSTIAIDVVNGKLTFGLTEAFVKSVDDVIAEVDAIKEDVLTSADRTAIEQLIANAKTEAIDASAVTVEESAGSGDILKTYTFTQNGKEIAKINLAKELVVTAGEIVEIDGVKNLQLTIANQDTPVNIPVNELVDAYTAGDYVEITDGNVINVKKDDIIAGLATDDNAKQYASDALAEAKQYADDNFVKSADLDVYTKTEVDNMFAWETLS